MPKSLERILTLEAEAENEWIAGVPRRNLFGPSTSLEVNEYWTGFRKMDEGELFELLSKNMQFRPRTEELERDESFKQVIPYFLVRCNGKYLTSVRKTKSGDVRLHNARLIGFGGHLRKEDITGAMKDWLKREFEEEIKVDKVKDIDFIGVVNDDNDPRGIGQVHFGLVFVVDVVSHAEIIEKDKFEKGVFMTKEELMEKAGEMESWSRLIIELL